MIPSGVLNEIVTIMQPLTKRGRLGQQEVEYEEIAECHAAVKFQKGTAALNVAEAWMQQQIVVTMRLNSVINEKCRLRWLNRLYDFDSFNVDRRAGTITIVATSVDEGTEALELDE